MIGYDSTGNVSGILPVNPGDLMGHWVAMNPLTGEKKWEIPLTVSKLVRHKRPGRLYFTGKLTGEFYGARRKHRQDAMAVQDGSNINATAITYAPTRVASM